MPFNLGPFVGQLPVKVGISPPSKAVIDPNIRIAKLADTTALSDLAADYDLITLAIPQLLNIDLFGLYTGSSDRIISDASRVVVAHKMLFPATPLFAGLTRDNQNLELNYSLLALPKGPTTVKFLQWLTTVAVTKSIDDLSKPDTIFDKIKLGVTTVPNVTVAGGYCNRSIDAHKYAAVMYNNDRDARWLLRVPIWYAGITRSDATGNKTTLLRFPEDFAPQMCTADRVAIRFETVPGGRGMFLRQATPITSSVRQGIEPIAAALIAKSNDPYSVSSVKGMCRDIDVTVRDEDLTNE